MTVRMQGRIIEWNDDKGFGFISQNGTGLHIFAHINSFKNKKIRPLINNMVTYEQSTDSKGRKLAIRIAYASKTPRAKPDNYKSSNVSLVLGVLFSVILILMAILHKISTIVPGILITISIFTFIVYFFDKSAAINAKQRTPEATLHMLSILGGWPGAALAQKILRHKSSKREFQSIFWITIIINLSFCTWLFVKVMIDAVYQ
jgi:uncharacterized membrane protein YsdA (DUF1294 family)/cold shock CspA family protein